MFNLDPGKLLVIAVVAIILLGPDRLPQVARQVGGAWRSFNEFRHRMESEVRSSMPDLPPTSEIARLARSPSALLNHLSTMSSGRGRRRTGRSRPPDDVGRRRRRRAARRRPPATPRPARGADRPAVADADDPGRSRPQPAPPTPTPAEPDRPVRRRRPGDPTLN